ncbi:protein translocase subunit SecF [Alkalihalobacillus hwajinpoensis]|nr:protein translocase subunit SecF [Pseudalkalibacillus hwajinpoensis]MCA0992799.1 protein translocase subunit SecF [Pseudalkalibacillus hwajinpoensis]
MSSKVRDTKFDFVKHRNKFFAISLALIVLGGLAIAIFGLNLGIDFSSGSRVDLQSESKLTTEEVSKEFEELGFDPESVTLAGGGEMAVAAFKDELGKDEIAEIKNHFTELYSVEPSISTVSPDVAVDLAKNAFIALAIASVGIIIYVALRFEWLQGVAAIVALFHDAFFIIAVFSILQIEVNITFIAAVLTIVGYSINDTIVTFDRIRENMKFEKKVKTFEDVARVVNKSLVQTLARSINTVLTVVFAAAALTIFGGEAIRPFAIALLIGLVAGTYSSLFIASQLWAVWKGKQLKKKKFTPAETEV